MGLLLNGAGLATLATEAAEKAEILNTFFVSAFTAKASSQESLTQEIREKNWRKADFPFM